MNSLIGLAAKEFLASREGAAGGGWGGMRAGFGLGVFGKEFCASKTGTPNPLKY